MKIRLPRWLWSPPAFPEPMFIVTTKKCQCAVCQTHVDLHGDYCYGCGLHVCVPCIFAPPKETWGPHKAHEHFKPRPLVPVTGHTLN